MTSLSALSDSVLKSTRSSLRLRFTSLSTITVLRLEKEFSDSASTPNVAAGSYKLVSDLFTAIDGWAIFDCVGWPLLLFFSRSSCSIVDAASLVCARFIVSNCSRLSPCSPLFMPCSLLLCWRSPRKLPGEPAPCLSGESGRGSIYYELDISPSSPDT